MNINLHIERLILDGIKVEPGQRHLLQSILVDELSRMLKEGGLPPSLSQNSALPGSAGEIIQLNETNLARLGHQIAQSIHGGIGHE